MAYCWDLETNVRQQRVFVTEHVRDKRGGGRTLLTTQRDIYEHTANQGARRVRACILGIIPRDVIEAATDQIYLTLNNSMDAPDEEIAKLVTAFSENFGVPKNALQKRLGKNLKAATAADVLRFRQIYRSLMDEMSVPARLVRHGCRAHERVRDGENRHPQTTTQGWRRGAGRWPFS